MISGRVALLLAIALLAALTGCTTVQQTCNADVLVFLATKGCG